MLFRQHAIIFLHQIAILVGYVLLDGGVQSLVDLLEFSLGAQGAFELDHRLQQGPEKFRLIEKVLDIPARDLLGYRARIAPGQIAAVSANLASRAVSVGAELALAATLAGLS